MEDFKVEIARAERPNEPMKYITLNATESESVFEKVIELGHISDQSSDVFFRAISGSLAVEITYDNVITEEFLRPLVSQQNDPIDRVCYVVWNAIPVRKWFGISAQKSCLLS